VTKSGSDTEKEIHINNNIDSDIDYEALYTIGDHVICYNLSEYFPGVINYTNPDGVFVSVMVMFGDGWNWPQEDNELWYSYNNIMQVIKRT